MPLPDPTKLPLLHKSTFEWITRTRAAAMPQAEQDAFIEWRAASITVLKHYDTRVNIDERGANTMQRQFTIELRVDFADAEKLEPLKQVLQQAARHAFATAQLISDNPKSTKIAIFSDDFFTGHETIALLEDTIQKGLDETGETSGSDTISSELANAAKGL